jgi:hypothetical protein
MIDLTRNDLQLISDLAAALARYRGETCCERLGVEAADILRRAGVLRRTPTSEVKFFLGTMVANGPVPQRQIEEQGRQRGFTANQLRTAKEALGILRDPARWHLHWAMVLGMAVSRHTTINLVTQNRWADSNSIRRRGKPAGALVYGDPDFDVETKKLMKSIEFKGRGGFELKGRPWL